MANPRGRGVPAYILAQSDFVTPASGNFQAVAYYPPESIRRNRNMVDDPEHVPGLANARDMQDPGPGFHRPTGQLVVPCDFNQLQWWLHMLLGDVTPTGEEAPYTWVWSSGADELPAYTLGLPIRGVAGDHHKRVNGLMANGITIPLGKVEGFRQLTVDFIARQVLEVDSGFYGAPVAMPTRSKIVGMSSQVLVNDVALTDLLDATLTIANNITVEDHVEADAEGLATRAMLGDTTITLDLRARVAEDDGLFDLFADHTAPISGGVKVVLEIDAGHSLEVDLPRCFGAIPDVPVSSGGELEFSAQLTARQLRDDSTPVAAATVTLLNDVDALA